MTTPLPYAEESVRIVHRPGRVIALYIPDLRNSRRAGYVWDHLSRHQGVEVIAIAELHQKVYGAEHAGWVITRGSYRSPPLPNREKATKHIKLQVSEHFSET